MGGGASVYSFCADRKCDRDRVGWINLKTLLGKTFRLFGHQKVPAIGGIGGKIPGLFPWKWVKPYTPHPTPVRTSAWAFVERKSSRPKPTPCPHEKLFAANPKYGKATVAVPPHNTSQNCSNCAQKVPKSRDVQLKTTESGFQRILYLC